MPFLFIYRNLQAAIGAYYDFESPNISVPSMSFVEDVTIGEGESIPPDTQFIKTWRIQNSGKCVMNNLPCSIFFFLVVKRNKEMFELKLRACATEFFLTHDVAFSCTGIMTQASLKRFARLGKV